jgi:CheY-like chemotaxis protein
VDQGLPDGLGTDLLKKMNKIRPFMGLILYTVHDDYDVKQICKFLGAKYHMKPASRLGLGDAVKGAAKQNNRQIISGVQNLLICEDNMSVQDIFKRQLKVIGYEADFADNGAKGIEALGQKPYSLVITDLHMPLMDGYGFTKTVREQEKETGQHLPIIAMTADVQLVHEQTYLQHGFDECLLKPVSLGQIRQLLIRWGLIQEQMEPQEAITPVATAEPVASVTSEIVVSQQDLNLPNKPPIDPAMAVDQFGAFDDDAKMMIGMFIQMSEPQIGEIADCFEQQDWVRLKGLAHSLKGAARSACCPQLGDITESVQNDSCSGFVDPIYLPRIKAAFENIKTAFSSL